MAVLTTEARNALPDSAFACVTGSGDSKERKYPHHSASGAIDLPHLRNALSRLAQDDTTSCGAAHLRAHAKAEGIGQYATKALMPIKAQLMDNEEEEAWFSGRTSRKLLMVPFGGPLPSAHSVKGMDIDGEFFDEKTDLYGPFKALRETRERLVDWNHSYAPPHNRTGDPTGRMSGAIIAKAIMDEDPDEDGLWADFWFRQGESRLNYIRGLKRRYPQIQFYGSGQAVASHVKANPDTGHIDRFPLFMETLTTAPQNTYSTFRPVKAVLADLDSAEIPVDAGLRAFLADLDALGADLTPTSGRSAATAKAGRVLSALSERRLREALAAMQQTLDELAAASQSTEPHEVT
jgi:hypothetical protein